MSPKLLSALTRLRLDMKAHPRAFTSKTPLAYFKRYYDIRDYLLHS